MRAVRGRISSSTGGRDGGGGGRGRGDGGTQNNQHRRQHSSDPPAHEAANTQQQQQQQDEEEDRKNDGHVKLQASQERKNKEAEQLLMLDSATSVYASQIPLPYVNDEPHFVSLPSTSETQKLCSRMAKSLETLPRSQRLRLPQHLVETVYGRDEEIRLPPTLPLPNMNINSQIVSPKRLDPPSSEQYKESLLPKISESIAARYSTDNSSVGSTVRYPVGKLVSTSSEETDETIRAGNQPKIVFTTSTDATSKLAERKVVEVTDLTSATDTSDVVYLGTKHSIAAAASSSGDSMDKWLDSNLSPKKGDNDDEDLDSWLDAVIS